VPILETTELKEEWLTVPSHTGPHNFNTSVHTDVTRMLTENRQAFIRFLRGRLGSTDIAEEVLQEFYVRALSKSSAIKKRESILQWLYRVLRSTLADFYRAKAARRDVETEYSHVQPAVVWDQFGKDPEAMCACLNQLLPALKPEYAEVLQRVDLRRESRRKVAGDLGITRNLVRVRLHRGRHALKRALLASCKGCTHDFMDCDCSHKTDSRTESSGSENCNATRDLPSI